MPVCRMSVTSGGSVGDLAAQVDAAPVGQPVVDHGEVGTVRTGSPRRRRPRSRDAAETSIPRLSSFAGQPLAHGGVVVHDAGAQERRRARPARSPVALVCMRGTLRARTDPRHRGEGPGARAGPNGRPSSPAGPHQRFCSPPAPSVPSVTDRGERPLCSRRPHVTLAAGAFARGVRRRPFRRGVREIMTERALDIGARMAAEAGGSRRGASTRTRPSGCSTRYATATTRPWSPAVGQIDDGHGREHAVGLSRPGRGRRRCSARRANASPG